MDTMLLDDWVAVGALTDRVEHARALRRRHDAYVSGRDGAAGVRAVVRQSWARSDAAGVDPDHHRPPIVMDEREVEERWRGHPLHPILPALRGLLASATAQSGHMLVITDARGVVLWIEGHHRVVEATEGMHFVLGADWSEPGAGTNALGTAIAVDHPVQIFSAEHFNRLVHPWQCSGAPIHDPETGEILGVVDLTGHLRTAHPHTLGLVTAAAQMAEAFLRELRDREDAILREGYLTRVAGTRQPTALVRASGRVVLGMPHGWLPPALGPVTAGELLLADGSRAVAEPLGDAFVVWRERPRRARARPLRLELGGARPRALLPAGGEVALSPRHAQLLLALAAAPAGLTAGELTHALYGEGGREVTVRAELSRLRRLLPGAVVARPYRLARDVVVASV